MDNVYLSSELALSKKDFEEGGIFFEKYQDSGKKMVDEIEKYVTGIIALEE